MHATSVANTSISLAWTAPTNSAEQSKSAPTDLATGDELAAGAAVAAAGDASEATSTTSPDSTSVPDAGENIDFVVQYGKVNNMTMYETVAKLENVSTPPITNSLTKSGYVNLTGLSSDCSWSRDGYRQANIDICINNINFSHVAWHNIA